jgi:hypothetical protein
MKQMIINKTRDKEQENEGSQNKTREERQNKAEKNNPVRADKKFGRSKGSIVFETNSLRRSRW